ncbi:MAG: hypothetical protein ABSB52_03500 [Acidimicrobiales bacterium]
MTQRPLVVILAGAIAFAAGCGSSAGGPNSSNGVQLKSGTEIVAAAVKATKEESSFHFEETATSGSQGVSVVADVGAAGGEQQITVRQGSDVGKVTVLLTGGTAYFEGDASGLEGLTGMSAKVAGEVAGKWISVPSTNSSFSALAGSLAVKTAAGQLVQLTGTLTTGKTSTKLGHPAVAVKATEKTKTASLALTMYVRTTGAALPISVEGSTQESGSAAHQISARFSDWGEALHLTAPTGALPIASVQALAS